MIGTRPRLRAVLLLLALLAGQASVGLCADGHDAHDDGGAVGHHDASAAGSHDASAADHHERGSEAPRCQLLSACGTPAVRCDTQSLRLDPSMFTLAVAPASRSVRSAPSDLELPPPRSD